MGKDFHASKRTGHPDIPFMAFFPQVASQGKDPTESYLSRQVHGEMLLSTFGRTQARS